MSYASTTTNLAKPQFGHAWRGKEGLRASVYLSTDVTLVFSSAADADAVIAAVTEARDALAALEAEGPQQEGEDRG